MTVFDELPPPVPPPALPPPAVPAPTFPALQVPNEQEVPTEHIMHVVPALPQALESLPVRHIPLESQQPVQVSALHRCVVEPQAARRSASITRRIGNRIIEARLVLDVQRQGHSTRRPREHAPMEGAPIPAEDLPGHDVLADAFAYRCATERVMRPP